MPRTTVQGVLACFDDEFADVASAFTRGEYLLWLGSGLSRDVVPNVSALLRRLLEYLQTRADFADTACRFNQALEDILDAAGVNGQLRHSIDLTTPLELWPEQSLKDLLDRMIDKYSDVLDVNVDGEDEDDFLVWTAIDVPATYGSPDLEPDLEHLCVAILMLEGVVRSAPTTNWDGLVEKAMTQLTGDSDTVLNVVVRPNDFTAPRRRAELVKFHGCAVHAAEDEAGYRDLLIARRTQISGWTTKPENQMMKARLEYLLSSQPALVIGLSAQDANIHTMLHQASQNLVRSWPAKPPSAVFAVQKLGAHHKLMLKVTYGSDYSPNRGEIEKAALLGSYAKPTLLGLVLLTLADKLCSLIGYLSAVSLTDADRDQLCVGIRSLRDAVSKSADADARAFINAVVAGMALGLSVFRAGRSPDDSPALYQPISTEPIDEAVGDPNFPHELLGRLALTLSLFGRGLAEGIWAIGLGNAVGIGDGVVRLTTVRGTTKVFLVQSARVLSELLESGDVDVGDPEVLVVCAEAVRRPAPRVVRARYGPDGRSGSRQVDLESVCASVTSADELFEAFKLEGGL